MPSSGCSTMAAFTLVLQHGSSGWRRPGRATDMLAMFYSANVRKGVRKGVTPKSDFADKKTNILTSGGDTLFT